MKQRHQTTLMALGYFLIVPAVASLIWASTGGASLGSMRIIKTTYPDGTTSYVLEEATASSWRQIRSFPTEDAAAKEWNELQRRIRNVRDRKEEVIYGPE